MGYDTAGLAAQLLDTVISVTSKSVYTRAIFTIGDVSTLKQVTAGADYDDGFIMWINGTEVYRSPEMPAGAPVWDTQATSHESSDGFHPITVHRSTSRRSLFPPWSTEPTSWP